MRKSKAEITSLLTPTMKSSPNPSPISTSAQNIAVQVESEEGKGGTITQSKIAKFLKKGAQSFINKSQSSFSDLMRVATKSTPSLHHPESESHQTFKSLKDETNISTASIQSTPDEKKFEIFELKDLVIWYLVDPVTGWPKIEKAVIKLNHQHTTAFYKSTIKVDKNTTVKRALKSLAKKMDIDIESKTLQEVPNSDSKDALNALKGYQCHILDTEQLLVPVLELWMRVGACEHLSFRLVQRPFAFLESMVEWTPADDEELTESLNINSLLALPPPTSFSQESSEASSKRNSNSTENGYSQDPHQSFVMKILYDEERWSTFQKCMPSRDSFDEGSSGSGDLTPKANPKNSNNNYKTTSKDERNSRMPHWNSNFIHVYIPHVISATEASGDGDSSIGGGSIPNISESTHAR